MVLNQAKKVKQHILRIARAMMRFKKTNREIMNEVHTIEKELHDVEVALAHKKDQQQIDDIKSRINNM